MDLSNERFKITLIVTFCVLISLLLLISIVRYINALPPQATVFPTPIQDSSTQRVNTFPTLKPEEVDVQLTEILNTRVRLTPKETDAIASLSADLVLNPYHSPDFEISYSPMLNLFFIHKKTSEAQANAAIIDFLKDPIIKDIYSKNVTYRLFVFSDGAAEYAKYTFERQYDEVKNKLEKRR